MHRVLPDAEGAIIALRWVAVAFAVVQTGTYYRPFPVGVERAAWAVVGAFAVATTVLTAWWMLRGRSPRRGRRPFGAGGAFGVVSLVVDATFASAVTWSYAFDLETAVFAIQYVVVIEAAYRFGMGGALWTMVGLAASYTLRDVWASRRWDIELLWASITFRMGLGFLIAAIAGVMANRAYREHVRLERALRAERDAAEALRSLDDLRSTFLAAVSHELRTPLTSILGFSLTIRDRERELDQASRAMLDHVVEQSRRLERLLEDLLDVERLGRGSVSIERHQVDVAALVRRRAEVLAHGTEQHIDVDPDPAIGVVDAAKVERLVDNLLGNAVKYSPAASDVTVHVERVADGILLSVDDEGPGVPDTLRSTIFEPFERGALTSAHMPGTGIGLTLVDRFARLHGGRAWVEERPDDRDGASFRVWLPDGPEGEQVVSMHHEAGRPPARPRSS